jgi:hypothetical protein
LAHLARNFFPEERFVSGVVAGIAERAEVGIRYVVPKLAAPIRQKLVHDPNSRFKGRAIGISEDAEANGSHATHNLSFVASFAPNDYS